MPSPQLLHQRQRRQTVLLLWIWSAALLLEVVNGLTARSCHSKTVEWSPSSSPSRQHQQQQQQQHRRRQYAWSFHPSPLLLQSFRLSSGFSDESSETATTTTNDDEFYHLDHNDIHHGNNNFPMEDQNDMDWDETTTLSSATRSESSTLFSKTLSVASPLSQFPSDLLEEHDVGDDHTADHAAAVMRTPFTRHDDWLERATEDFLNVNLYPIGRLTPEDVDSISGLMAAWVRRRSVEAALTVEQLLKRVVDDMRANNPTVHVTTRMYTIAMDAWAKSNATGRSAQRAQHIHDTMVHMYQQTQNPMIQPSTISYNTLMNAHSKSCEPQAPQMVERVLQEMLTLYRQNDYDGTVKPDAITFSTMMDCYAKVNPPNSTERSEELFHMMDDLNISRNVYTFSALQNVYARSGRPDAPLKAEAILDYMLDLYHNQGHVFAKPNCINYNAVLGALSRTPCRASVQRAHALLQQMELPVSQGGLDVEPDRLSYALTILCCTRCPDDDTYGATLAEANLLKMEARAQQDLTKKQELSSAAPPLVSLDVECFNVVLTAISKCPQLPNAVDRAIAIVQRMEEYAQEPRLEELRPNVRTWNAVLNVLARSKDKKAARKAEQILNHMHELHARGIPNVKPDAFSFAAVLSAYQKSSEPNAVQRADDLLRRMEELYDRGDIEAPPDVFHYTIVCGAWAKSARQEQYRTMAPDRCVQILTHMMERDRAGYPDVKPNVRSFNAVLDCLSRSKQEEKAEQLLYFMLQLYRQGDRQSGPDAFSFNAVINAMTRSRHRDSGKRAEAILERFLEYHLHENPKVRPDSRAFTHIIAYYGRSTMPDAPYRAEYVLNRMVSLFKSGKFPELAPNNFAVSTVMDAYTHARHPDAGRCAERLLKLFRELHQEHGATKLVLNSAIMNSVLHAWAVCGDENAGRFAELHLDEMERSYHELGRLEVRPDTRSYGLVLHAWSKSSSFDKARRALQVLRRMILEQTRNDNVFPGEHAYSLVINACAFSDCGSPEVQEEAFEIAVTVFDELLARSSPSAPSSKPTLRPSSLAFGWFLQACGRLKVSEKLKNTQIERAFLACCEYGLVNDFVLYRFRFAAPEPMYRQLLAPVFSRFPAFTNFEGDDDDDVSGDPINDEENERYDLNNGGGIITTRDEGSNVNKDENHQIMDGVLSVGSLFPPALQHRPKHKPRFRITTTQLPHEWTKNVGKSRYFPPSVNTSYKGNSARRSEWDTPMEEQ